MVYTSVLIWYSSLFLDSSDERRNLSKRLAHCGHDSGLEKVNFFGGSYLILTTPSKRICNGALICPGITLPRPLLSPCPIRDPGDTSRSGTHSVLNMKTNGSVSVVRPKKPARHIREILTGSAIFTYT